MQQIGITQVRSSMNALIRTRGIQTRVVGAVAPPWVVDLYLGPQHSIVDLPLPESPAMIHLPQSELSGAWNTDQMAGCSPVN